MITGFCVSSFLHNNGEYIVIVSNSVLQKMVV